MAEHVEEATGQRVVVSKKSSKRKRKREQKESSVGDPPLINLENEDGPLSKKVREIIYSCHLLSCHFIPSGQEMEE